MPGTGPGVTAEGQCISLLLVVMAGHSRPKDGVLSHAYVPAIYVFDLRETAKTWMPATSAGMTFWDEESRWMPGTGPGITCSDKESRGCLA